MKYSDLHIQYYNWDCCTAQPSPLEYLGYTVFIVVMSYGVTHMVLYSTTDVVID